MSLSFLPSPELMQKALWSCLPEFASVQWLEQVNSTNILLLQDAKSEQQESVRPALVGAHYQTSGRGRLGRKWAGQQGATLMFSCAYDVHLAPSRLSAIAPLAGIVACEQLRQLVDPVTQVSLSMKWPNDILYGEGKLSGLLVESVRPVLGRASQQHHVVVIGMGMNLADAKQLGVHLGRKVSDWASVLRDMHKDEQLMSENMAHLVARIAKAWGEAILLYEREGFAPFIERHRALDALANQEILLWQDGKVVTQGMAAGLDEHAHLLLRTEQGEILPLLNGEISIRAVGADVPA